MARRTKRSSRVSRFGVTLSRRRAVGERALQDITRTAESPATTKQVAHLAGRAGDVGQRDPERLARAPDGDLAVSLTGGEQLPHSIAEHLHLAQEVAGDEDGPPGALLL
jgi:hypothetical protein